MAYTKYSLTPANNTATPPDGAPEGMLPSAVNDTMRDMMAQIRDVGDGIRDGTYTMTAAKITGGTITGVAFTGNTFTSPVISGGSINNATIGATTANTGKFTTLEATGVATFSAGTVSAPALTTTGDTNTGIFFPAADTIAFTEGGVEAMRIDSSGNVGIGVTVPQAQLNIANATTATLRLTSIGTANLDLSCSATTASVGSPNGIALLFNTQNLERMRITSAGNVGIGTSSPSEFLTVGAGTASVNSVVYLNGGSDSTKGAGIKLAKAGTAFGFIGAASWMEGGTSNNLAFSANSSATVGMRLDSSGNLGLGVTPSAWNSVWRSMQLGSGASVSGRTDSVSITYLQANTFRQSGNWVYLGTGAATSYEQSAGAHIWSTAASGTAGNTITFTQAMTLDASGNLLVGGTTNSFSARIYSLETSATEKNNLALYTTGAHNTTRIALYNDSSSASVQSIAGALSFSSGGVGSSNERMRITSAGNVGIGTSSPNSLLNTYNATSNSLLVQGDSTTNILVNRASSDATAPSLVTRKSRGTIASQTAVNSGDSLGNITFQGYGGTNNRSLANIVATVDTYTSDSNISSYLTFGTSASGAVSSTERMRIDSSGNVLVGTTSDAPRNFTSGTGVRLSSNLEVANTSSLANFFNITSVGGGNIIEFRRQANTVGSISTDATNISYNAQSALVFGTGGSTERMRISSSGDVFVGGTTQNTSTGIVYARTTAKAWCFVAAGTSPTINGSFNVSSITYVAPGDFNVNFTAAMPNANYSSVATNSGSSANNIYARSTSASVCRIVVNGGANNDFCLVIFSS